jgi:hypothetical protein
LIKDKSIKPQLQQEESEEQKLRLEILKKNLIKKQKVTETLNSKKLKFKVQPIEVAPEKKPKFQLTESHFIREWNKAKRAIQNNQLMHILNFV